MLSKNFLNDKDYSPDYGSVIRVSKRTIIGGDLITLWEKPGIYGKLYLNGFYRFFD
jgi:hypothetical protein